MNVSMSNNNLPIEEPGEDFPDPSELEWGLDQDSPGNIQPEGEVSNNAPDVNPDTSSIDVLLLLGLGVVLQGLAGVNSRLQAKRISMETSYQPKEPIAHPEDENELLRYALIGMILDTPRVVRRQVSQVVHLADSAYNGFNDLFRPLTSSRVFRPINTRFSRLTAKGERVVNHWIDTGRRGEKNSQALLLETTDEVVAEVINKLAQRPEITELVQQQSVGMVGELSEELQGRTAAIDTILERIVFRLIPGTKSDTTPTLIIPIPEDEQQSGLKKQSSRGRS